MDAYEGVLLGVVLHGLAAVPTMAWLDHRERLRQVSEPP